MKEGFTVYHTELTFGECLVICNNEYLNEIHHYRSSYKQKPFYIGIVGSWQPKGIKQKYS